jgi:hypothetical protein
LGAEVEEVFGCGVERDLPLSQINLLPLLIQVNFLPLFIFVCPEIVHLAPDFGAGAATAVDATSTSGSRIKSGLIRIAKG